ncbi:Transcription initiation factor IIE subunit beta [Wickerhamomyces ciferrii]|uniref:Transcription initiation factor IIE subunit beta n=1 Tax=Wickerhamomyces ciferrii (strain ATCC 14091 / BCRC 22168 / CBS 111 / JCM 3599 / NBRC 0793 / NRRL Y-1031 F-60-10) TaxID=1206466 RepID=K0KN27_WICCF|nr:Transcription initiation factor IIE subunit beta [Wickerhamomyces ciferrii]CCH44376.1 Transcription initiation factor IIE subunit beta [Wickerhamomyces ciferrii]
MSNPLLANLNAFKNKVKTAPVLPSRRPNSTPPPPSQSQSRKPLSSSSSGNKRSALDYDDDDEFDDKPIKNKKPAYDTSGSHLSTKLLLAVEYIKERVNPVPIDTLLSYLSLNNDEQKSKLLTLVKNLDKIYFNPDDNTLEYVSIHNIKDKNDLLIFLRQQPTFKGISVKELKDGWNECIQSINELEEEGSILVLRTKKDNHPRLVWANVGGELGIVDEEFVKLWLNVKLPDRSELPGLLNKRGLKPASVDPATVKNTNNEPQKKRKQRKGKITNTHMTGILKDYSQGR